MTYLVGFVVGALVMYAAYGLVGMMIEVCIRVFGEQRAVLVMLGLIGGLGGLLHVSLMR